MTVLLWLARLARANAWRAAGTAAGVGISVALLGSLGAFLTSSFGTMTDRVIASVPVDWQVLVAPPSEMPNVTRALRQQLHVEAFSPVYYADVRGLAADIGGTVQTTGAAQVVGIEENYAARFPAELRPLAGSQSGVLLAQQTAANLHARKGDRITVRRSTGPPVEATVDGIVDMPFADSFFQSIGVPSAAAPQAPPDNVVIIPSLLWHRWFDSALGARSASTRVELHVRFERKFPHDPFAALSAVASASKSLELQSAGAAMVGDNLAAALQGAREDALYARLLFFFLGLPGAALAIAVALAFVASNADRRRREAALLRIRGATIRDIARLLTAEAIVVSGAGAILGFAITSIAARAFAGGAAGDAWAAFEWAAAAALVNAICIVAAFVLPLAGAGAAAGDLKPVETGHAPAWRTYYIDWLTLAASAIFFWKTAATGYQIVLAPEGVLASSVSYDAFLGPLLLWLGASLLIRRLAESALSGRGRLVARGISPFAGSLSIAVGAAVSRQRSIVSRAVTLLALAISFAVSTAVFDATYNAQSRVDAELTNGADVTLVLPDGFAWRPLFDRISKLSGVAGAAVMQHRFAYVGQDLQDFYGIDPATISNGTQLSDAYFANRDARAALSILASTPDAAFVSAETANDYQLKLGDRINLRLQSGRSGSYRRIPFTFAGVVREFPTAPRDSFIVTNAAYATRATGADGPTIVLLRAGGDPARLAAFVKEVVADVPGARVSDIASAQRAVGTSLTSVDLRGLSAIELGFALLLLAGTAGLSLALGFAERRRMFAVLAALGATPRQLGAFLWTEAGGMLLGGLAGGFALGFGVAAMLAKVLTGVFDPPPDALTVPWSYLVALAALSVAATAVAVAAASALARRDPVRVLRS